MAAGATGILTIPATPLLGTVTVISCQLHGAEEHVKFSGKMMSEE